MVERVLIDVRGVVQGVGFRPHVYALATSMELRGFVRNQGTHVFIDVEGESGSLSAFLDQLTRSAPEPASVERVDSTRAAPARHPRFFIAPSQQTCASDRLVSPDLSTCTACLAELFDAANRRYEYPFVTCSLCGPRYTVLRDLPYDRERTTMAGFAMCDQCRREYEDPADRRFHAQTIACATCGPVLSLHRDGRRQATGPEALAFASSAVRSGLIVAVKGLGGYHLACDAINASAVARLRQRKGRDAKPFAIMVREEDVHEWFADQPVAETLHSSDRPIVLIATAQTRERPLAGVAANVARGCPSVGVMLPYTPLHHLLLRDSPGPLVVTSGNRSGEPICYQDEDALERLARVADAVLTHDRPIHARCDDSVVQVTRRTTTVIRRSRGIVPRPIRLSEPASEPILAVGGHQKNAFCLVAGHEAYLSPHMGDLDEVESYQALPAGIAEYQRLFGFVPAVVAHDRHPDYGSTRIAERIRTGRTVPVQHHHAHVLSCVAEHGIAGPVLGIAFDGAGLGDDGAVWGGEFLRVEGVSCERLGHLSYVALPGGDRAARAPWRMALAHALAAGVSASHPLLARIRERVGASTFDAIRRYVVQGVNVPRTSSMGRLFDAVAALVGLRDTADFEGQPAMELEAIAETDSTLRYEFDVVTSSRPWRIDAARLVRSVIRDVCNQQSAGHIAGAFHESVGTMVTDVSARLARESGIRTVVLTGGVFQNARLTEASVARLSAAQLDVLTHERVPCNDGGLALGQALYAARLTRSEALAES